MKSLLLLLIAGVLATSGYCALETRNRLAAGAVDGPSTPDALAQTLAAGITFPRPGSQEDPSTNVRIAHATQELIVAIDRYTTTIQNESTLPALELRRQLSNLRFAAEYFLRAVNGKYPFATLRTVVDDIVNQYTAAERYYARLVLSDGRFKSEIFQHIGDSVDDIIRIVT